MCLEEKKVIKFEVQHWDPNECYRITTNLESLNDFEDSVFIIHVLYKGLKIWLVNDSTLEVNITL